MKINNSFENFMFQERNIKNIINIKSVKIDSRSIEKNDLFIAIRGGNNYVEEALGRGAFVVFDDKNLEEKKNSFKVKDSVKFLQNFAKFHRENNKQVFVVGITGSNGKTTTKDILYSILNKSLKGKKTLGNLNNHIGLPLTLLRIEEDDNFMVLEMGMSNLGEIALLGEIARPDYGIITNIGDSHLENLKTRENVFKAKTELLDFVSKKTFVNGDDLYLKGLDVLKLGFGENNDFIAENLLINREGSFFDLKIDEKTYKMELNLYGEYNVLNSLLAIAVAKELGLEMTEIKSALNKINITGMRFEKIEKKADIIINDAYNASPVSMKCSIETFNELYSDKFRVLVLGDMLELGEKSKEFHIEIKESLKKVKADIIFLYGREIKALYDEIKDWENSYYFNFNEKEILKEKLEKIKKEKVILLKASRGMRLEEII